MTRFPITDGTAFPAKTHEYGRRTRYEIRRSTDGGKGSTLLPSDQPTKAGNQWAYDTLEKAQAACNNINSAQGGDVANDRYKILDYSIARNENEERGTMRVRVYLLNVGDVFHGFGGSRHGLVVRKKASLIVRELDHGLRDHEYDLNSENAWSAIERGRLIAAGVKFDE